MVEVGDGGGGGENQYSRELCGGTHVRSTAEIGAFRILHETFELRQRAAHRGRHGPCRRRSAARARPPVEGHGGAAAHASRGCSGGPGRARTGAQAPGEGAQGRRRRACRRERPRPRVAGRARPTSLAAQPCSRQRSTSATPRRCSTCSIGSRAVWRDAAILLGTAADGRVHLVASVAPALVERGVKAGAIVKSAAEVVGGGGGGRDTMAQAGGRDPERLGEAIEAGRRAIEAALAG